MIPAGTTGVAVGVKDGMVLVLVPAETRLYTVSPQMSAAVHAAIPMEDVTFDSIDG